MKIDSNKLRLIQKIMVLIFLDISTFSSTATLVLSRATNNVYVGICSENAVSQAVDFKNDIWITTNSPIRYDESLAIMFFCKTGTVPILVPSNKRIFIKFSMRDKVGKKIEKTLEGSTWGIDIEHFPKEPGMKIFDKMASWGAIPGPDTKYFQGWPGGPSLPALEKLFEIKTNGFFYLTLEVHVMKQRMVATNNWTWDHIAIPPVTVEVVKPPEAK